MIHLHDRINLDDRNKAQRYLWRRLYREARGPWGYTRWQARELIAKALNSNEDPS